MRIPQTTILLVTAASEGWSWTLDTPHRRTHKLKRFTAPPLTTLFLSNNDDSNDIIDMSPDEDEDNDEDDVNEQFRSEFDGSVTSAMDWGGALGQLRKRIDLVQSGKNKGESYAMFRKMTSQSPNEAINSLVSEASPEVVQAMSAAVSSLVGGLNNPMIGAEVVVKATGEKLAALCFQLQMTGYMFRNAEYVLALKDLMNINGTSIDDYKAKFDELDTDGSGYIDASEVEELLRSVYDEKPPAFEVQSFIKFFDQNNDGRISWKEFEKGLRSMTPDQAVSAVANKSPQFALPGDEPDDNNNSNNGLNTSVSGVIEVELEDGRVIEVDSQEYIQGLKDEAQALKDIIAAEKGTAPPVAGGSTSTGMFINKKPDQQPGGISAFVASLGEKNMKKLTEGISPQVIDAMKMLVDYVIDGRGPDNKGGKSQREKEMELPGSALQQLALWQLVIGYRLRESEATGEHMKMLE